jgi:hypothetical protein
MALRTACSVVGPLLHEVTTCREIQNKNSILLLAAVFRMKALCLPVIQVRMPPMTNNCLEENSYLITEIRRDILTIQTPHKDIPPSNNSVLVNELGCFQPLLPSRSMCASLHHAARHVSAESVLDKPTRRRLGSCRGSADGVAVVAQCFHHIEVCSAARKRAAHLFAMASRGDASAWPSCDDGAPDRC